MLSDCKGEDSNIQTVEILILSFCKISKLFVWTEQVAILPLANIHFQTQERSGDLSENFHLEMGELSIRSR